MGPEVRDCEPTSSWPTTLLNSTWSCCFWQVKKSAVSEDLPSKCSNQLRVPASQSGESINSCFNHIIFVWPKMLSKHLCLCFLGRANRWRPEWSDSYLGSQDGPQWAAHSRARGLNQLCSHWPRCELHGSSQQLGQYPDNRERLVKLDCAFKTSFFCPSVFLNRETVMCGILLEAWEMKWLS